ncbi:MAG TPA: hypothetical protein VFH53_10145 [Phycisphaerae bacterium]|nr:hypothetical protein [Phycisphaerae bacterium]
MATTAIGNDRSTGSALERYPDAVFVRDDKVFYLGNDGDFSLWYDETTDDVVKTAGADLRISDTQKIQFGDGADVTLTWDGTNLLIAGFPSAGLSDVNPATSNALWFKSDWHGPSDYVLCVSTGL